MYHTVALYRPCVIACCVFHFVHFLHQCRLLAGGYEPFRHRYPGTVHYYHSHKGMWDGRKPWSQDIITYWVLFIEYIFKHFVVFNSPNLPFHRVLPWQWLKMWVFNFVSLLSSYHLHDLKSASWLKFMKWHVTNARYCIL